MIFNKQIKGWREKSLTFKTLCLCVFSDIIYLVTLGAAVVQR